MRKLTDSIELKHDKDRAILTATATTDEIRTMATAANTPPPPPPPTLPPAAASPVARTSKH